MLHAWSIWDAEAGFDDLLQMARRALSLFQHHDGITGTARDYVMKDYDRQMLEALVACKFIIQQSAYRYLTKSSVSEWQTTMRIVEDGMWKFNYAPFIFQIYHPDYKFTYFHIDDSRTYNLLSDNRPTIILGDDLPTKYVVVHNALAQEREEVVEFHVSKPFVMVEDMDGKSISSQVAPMWQWNRVYNGLGPQASTTKYRLMFKAKIPPMGLSTYVIRSTTSVETSV